MNIDKEKIKELAKSRGLDIAEELVEDLCHLAIDVVKEVSKGNLMVAGIVAAAEPAVRDMIDKIDIDKDGE